MSKPEITWKLEETEAPLPPKVPGLPFLGNALQLRSDPANAIAKMYQKYGPIFRIRILNRPITVLAGMEANKFTTQNDEQVFTNELQFGFLLDEVGPALTALPPGEHKPTRKILRSNYSPSIAWQRLDILIKVVDEFIDSLNVGQSFVVFPTMQRLVVTQLGLLMLNHEPGEYFDDFRTFMLTMLQVYQFRTRSPKALKSPAYIRAKQRVMEMAQKVVEDNRRMKPGIDRPQNGIDLLMESVDVHGQPFTEAHLLFEAMSPYLAGQDTVAGTLSFICYTVHKYPDVLARIIPEVRQAFEQGQPGMEDFRKLDTLHKTIVETMRLYPVAPFMPRHANCTFEFAGYRVDAGTEVYTSTTVPHFLPEFYPDPYTFNIDREKRPAGSFAPYGVGNYACLGAGIADVQLLVTMAALLNRGRFELNPPGYTAKLQSIPLPNPGKYMLKLAEKY